MGGHVPYTSGNGAGVRAIKPPMTFTLDGDTLINLAFLLAFIGFMWKLNRDVGRIERRVVTRIGVLSDRILALAERIARIEERLEGRWRGGSAEDAESQSPHLEGMVQPGAAG